MIGKYKTQKGAYILDDTGVLGQFPQAPSIFYNSKGSGYHKFSTVPISYDEENGWYGGDIYVYRGSGKTWYKDIFIQKDDIHLKYSKTEKISLTDLLAQESAKGKDFTGEGVIGDKISKVFTNGSGQKNFINFHLILHNR